MKGQGRATLGSLLAAVGAVWALSCGSRSDRVPVRLQLWYADTVVAQVRLATGVDGTLTVEGGESLRLTPSLQFGVLEVGVRRIGTVPLTARDSLDGLLRFKGSERVAIPGSALAVEWLAGEAVGSGAAKPTACSRCCITCTGVTVCACSVNMSCGGCACDRGCTASVGQIAPLSESPQVPSLSASPSPIAERTANRLKQAPTERPTPTNLRSLER
jgi:hypothetical protein